MTAAFMRPLPTPIGDGLTELTTSIQFDPVMLAPPDPSPHDPLGLPPQPLRAVHWPALIQECVLRIRAVLAHPLLPCSLIRQLEPGVGLGALPARRPTFVRALEAGL
ncbi:MAG TPA: hypothetical protein PKE15_03660, partial [Ottowia sp.]|nr:hypothetical protein [Ottowia sp.]